MKFKPLFFLLLALVLFCLCSCEQTLGAPKFSKVNILVYGNDYYYKPQALIDGLVLSAGQLLCTVNDATQVGLALEALAEKSGIECEAIYVTGKNYTIKGENAEAIIYVPEDKSDHNTSKAHFRELMANLAKNSTESDLTIIFFSCHGFNQDNVRKKEYGSSSNTSFAMCANSSSSELFRLYTHDEFKEDLAAISGTKVVFADVCYSGGLVDASNVAVNTEEYKNINESSLFWDYDTLTVDPSTFILTASRYYEQSYEPLRGHGYFTAVLLDALSWDEENQQITKTSGTITFFGLCQYVVANNPINPGQIQNPMLSSGSNDVILFNLN